MSQGEQTDSNIKFTRVFSRTPSSWDPQDDILLRHLKEQQKLGWKEIAAHFNHRTPNACQFRWRRLRSGALKSSQPPSPNVTPTPISGSSSGIALNKPKSNLSEKISASKTIVAIESSSSSASPPSSSIKDEENKTINVNATSCWVPNSETKPISITSYNNAWSTERNMPWEEEEDELLLSRTKRELSFAELSILLPSRSENDIWSRIDYLEKSQNVPERSSSSFKLSQSPGALAASSIGRSMSISSLTSSYSNISSQPPSSVRRESSTTNLVGGPLSTPSYPASFRHRSITGASFQMSSSLPEESLMNIGSPLLKNYPRRHHDSFSTEPSSNPEKKDSETGTNLPSINTIFNNTGCYRNT
ncbi:BA75_02096T0 [Komagataella pastoris]|uniref:BA75_02096T0 n=1 Tax=Komagataella pastoris TaxID=4922 RepID=A0A1B2JC93_PICPA|nr:BA75_02096T0 [Komagataella pastoris]